MGPINKSKAQSPLSGCTLCCTSLTVDRRDEVHRIATTLGANCVFDLTVDVTHLVIGEVCTPKYAYVARERPDVRVVVPGFVSALREAWMDGEDEVDVESVERKFQAPTFMGLKICLTGFGDAASRENMIQRIKDYGAEYRGDMTRESTHLIVKEAKGKKYEMAPMWGVKVVSEEWLFDSIERGMALQEALYDPKLTPAERGKDAWRRNGGVNKRLRDQADQSEVLGKRKLRKTMSQKLSNHHDAIWADIAAIPAKRNSQSEWQADANGAVESAGTLVPESYAHPKETVQSQPGLGQLSLNAGPSEGVFSGTTIFMRGFTGPRISILRNHLTSHGAIVFKAPDDPAAALTDISNSQIFIVSPHDIPILKLPPIPNRLRSATAVTEFWVENCITHKSLIFPRENRLCAPFFNGTIPGFEDLTMCSTSFHGVDVLHVSKMVKLLGATYDEYLKSAVSVLLCASDSTEESRKRQFAHRNNIPAVSLDWLWACINAAAVIPFEGYLLDKLALVHPLKQSTEPQVSTYQTTKTVSAPSTELTSGRLNRKPKAQNRSERQLSSPSPSLPAASPNLDIHQGDASNGNNAATSSSSPRRGKTQAQPLADVSPHKLNSPSRSTSPEKLAPEPASLSILVAPPAVQEEDPAPKSAAPSSASSATSKLLTTELTAILAKKRATRTVSAPAISTEAAVVMATTDVGSTPNRLLRRKVAARGLGRAASTGGVDVMLATVGSGVQSATGLGKNTPDAEADRENEALILSQKLVYEESEMRERKKRLLEELGAGASVKEGVSESGEDRKEKEKGKGRRSARVGRKRRS